MLETVTSLNNSIYPTEIEESQGDMPSLNHSYVCLQLLKQLIINDETIPLPELTLDIANGLTPDISVFPNLNLRSNPV